MEIVLELLVEFLSQIIFEFLLEGSFRWIARLLSSSVVRTVFAVGLAVAVGYSGGYWWGSRLTELGRTDPPTSLWVSLGLTVLFITLAVARALPREKGEAQTPSQRERLEDALVPWRWSVLRLLGYALLNASVAAGVAVGVTPKVLG